MFVNRQLLIHYVIGIKINKKVLRLIWTKNYVANILKSSEKNICGGIPCFIKVLDFQNKKLHGFYSYDCMYFICEATVQNNNGKLMLTKTFLTNSCMITSKVITAICFIFSNAKGLACQLIRMKTQPLNYLSNFI